MSFDQDDNSTGARTQLKHYGSQFSVNSDIQEDRSFSYNSGAQTSGSVDSGVTMQRQNPSQRSGGGQRSQSKSTPARRDAVRRGIQKAIRESEAMLASLDVGESTLASNVAFRLRDTLQDLWELRSEREDDWGDLLNVLQVAFGIEDYDSLTRAQGTALKRVISEYLSMHTVDVCDIEASVQLLRKCGLDPFGWSGAKAVVDMSPDETKQ
jgi:hypothetical protein